MARGEFIRAPVSGWQLATGAACALLMLGCTGRAVTTVDGDGGDDGAAADASASGTSAAETAAEDGGDAGDNSTDGGDGPAQDMGGDAPVECVDVRVGPIAPGPSPSQLRVRMQYMDTGLPAGTLMIHVDTPTDGTVEFNPWPALGESPAGCGACARFRSTEGLDLFPAEGLGSLTFLDAPASIADSVGLVQDLELRTVPDAESPLCLAVAGDIGWNRRPSPTCMPAFQDFGDCDASLGVAYDGATCRPVSGCDCGDSCEALFPDFQSCAEGCAEQCPDNLFDDTRWRIDEWCLGVSACVPSAQVADAEAILMTNCGPYTSSWNGCGHDGVVCNLFDYTVTLSSEEYRRGCMAGLIPDVAYPYCGIEMAQVATPALSTTP